MNILPLAAALILAPVLAWSGDAPLTVFVCAGQSNMVGKRSQAKDLPPELAGEQAQVLFFTGTDWVALKPGVSEPKGFGPEISFGHAMAQALGRPIGLIKYSKGGTNLAQEWNPAVAGNLYADLVALVAKAKATRPIEVAGMLWMQGEADTKSAEMAGAYATNLAGLIAAARKDFASPGMTFVCGRINSPSDPSRVAAIRKAQESCPLVGFGFIDCDDLPKGSDNLHYTTAGVVEMGRRMAKRCVELLTANQKPGKP